MNAVSGFRLWFPNNTRNLWCLFGALLVALLLDFIYYTGFYASDDSAYLFAARGIATRSLDVGVRSLSAPRLGINIPNALAYLLGGGSTSFISWFHILYHLGLVWLSYVLGKLAHSENVGLFAALLVAANPIFYGFAGAVFPDLPTSLWLAVFMLILELARRASKLGPVSHRSAFSYYFAGGFTLGVAYSCKETALIMTVPAAIVIMLNAPRLRHWSWLRDGAFLATGLLFFMGCEFLVLKALSGDWVFRIARVAEAGSLFEQRMTWQGRAPIERFQFAIGSRLLPWMPLGLWLLLGAATSYVFYKKRSHVFSVFFWWSFLYLTVGSTSFTSYKPPSIQARYYAIAFVPAAIMLAATSVHWLTKLVSGKPLLKRIAPFIALLSFGGMAVYEAANSIHRAGTLFHASAAGALIHAVQTAEKEYPEYSILLSYYFRQRATPLFFPKAPPGLIAHSSLTPGAWPDPPFLYIEPRTRKWQSKEIDGYDDVQSTTLGSFYGPKGRWEVIVNSAMQLFSVGTKRPLQRRASRGVLLKLISKKGSQVPELTRPKPEQLFVLDGDSSVESKRATHFVTWRDPNPFYLQFFDNRGFKIAPRNKTATFVSPTSEFEVALTFRSKSSTPVRLLVHTYGYAEDESFVHEESQVDLARVGEATTKISLKSEKKMTHYKVRIRVRPGSSRGKLLVGIQTFLRQQSERLLESNEKRASYLSAVCRSVELVMRRHPTRFLRAVFDPHN